MVSEEKQKVSQAKKMLVYLGIGSIVMFFAAFTSAYIILQADHYWVKDTLPGMFAISTVVIAVSSVTMWLAGRAIAKDDRKGLRTWLAATLALGIGFTATQYAGWQQLHAQGKFFVSHIGNLKGEYGKDFLILQKGEPLLHHSGSYFRPDDIGYERPLDDRINETFNVSASFLFILSGLHIAHLIGGLIWLIALIIKASKGAYTAQSHLGVSLGSIYWHFLDVLWIYLFLFLTFIR